MIKNIIFDIGNVLLHFKPLEHLKTIYRCEEVISELYETIFSSEEWVQLDEGTIEAAQALDQMCRRCPHLQEEIRKIMDTWDELLTPVEGMIPLLERLKDSGYRLYFLSNFHSGAFQKIWKGYDFFRLFDGGIVSAHVKLIKPHADIYKKLIDTYALLPDESVFIDDLEKNVKGAADAGIRTINFDRAEQAVKELRKLGVQL